MISTGAQEVAFLYFGTTSQARLFYSVWILYWFQWAFFLTHVISVISGKVQMGFRLCSVDKLFIIHGLIICTEESFQDSWGRRFPVEFTVPSSITSALGLPATQGSIMLSLAHLVIPVLLVLPGVILTISAVHRSISSGHWHLFGRFLFYTVLSAYNLPYNLYWFGTWAPQYSLLILSLVSKHMKREPIPWWISLLLVAATSAFFPVT